MLAILIIVAPVFGIILLGWLAARSGYLEAAGARILSGFAFKVAMPALLFRASLEAGVLAGEPTRLLAAYFGATLLTWITATMLSALVLRRPASDGAAIAMGATFGNTVMLGFPLVISAFGPEAAAPMTLLITIETPLLWAMATVHMSLAAHDGGARVRSVLADILLEVVKSPIVMSLLLGALGRAVGLTLPPIADRIFALLSQAAVPTALFAVGMTLAVNGVRGQVPTLSVICALKLLVYPAFVWALAVHVFALPPLWVSIAVLLAGMPVGVVAFLFATRYERAVEPVSAAVSVSTAIAVLTVSALLYGLGTGAR